MSLGRIVVLGLLLLGSSAPPGLARQATAPCDPRLVPVDGELGYRRRNRAARCEGLYRSPISAGGLELVSLHQGSLRFELGPDVRLQLAPPTGASQVAGQRIRVRAVALPLRTYYRLDGIVSPGTPLEWPVGDVLLRARLADNQVGVFGWLDSSADTKRLFVPLRVVESDSPAAGPSSTVLVVRTANAAETMQWRSYTEPLQAALPPWAVAARSIDAGRTVSLGLPDGPEAVLTVDIAAKSVDSDRWSSLRIRVIRPATP